MAKVSSPCIRNCCLNDDDICLGCFRSMQEILRWGSATDEERLKMLELASARSLADCANPSGK